MLEIKLFSQKLENRNKAKQERKVEIIKTIEDKKRVILLKGNHSFGLPN